MNYKSTILTLVLLLAFISSEGQTNHFDETELLENIKTLSSDAYEGRRTGTKGAIKAKHYIIDKFTDLGILPLGKSFEQTFSFKRKTKTYAAANVLGLIKGTAYPDSYIVISAHYDHEGIKKGKIYNGADDDASGISALFSFAEYLKSNAPKHSVILAAFDAEELGLKGAKHFAENSIIPTKSIFININMDMISRNDKNELYAVGTRYNSTLKKTITNFKQSEKIKLLMGHDGKDGKDDWTYSSDHGPFHKKEIPFIYFGVEDHKDYHRPTDDYKNIHPEFYKEAVHVIIRAFADIDALERLKK